MQSQIWRREAEFDWTNWAKIIGLVEAVTAMVVSVALMKGFRSEK